MNGHESVELGPPADECPDNVSVADSTDKSTPGFLEMIASARVAIVVMCFFGILACGAIAAAVSDVSCDNALDDTRGVMDNAVVSCFETSSRSLESTMYEMLSYVSVGVVGNTKSFMDENDKILQDLNTVVTVMRRDENKSTQAWAEQTASMQWQRMKSFISNPALPSTIRGIGIFADGHYASAHDMTSGLWMFVPNPVPLETFSRFYNWSGFFKVYPPSLGSVAEPVTGLPLLTGRPLRDYTFFYLTPLSLMGPRLSRTGYIPDGAVRWSNVQNLGNFLGYMLTQRLVDPAGSVKDLEVVVFMTISHIEAFLQKASSGAKDVKAGSKPRIWVTIASSWLAEAQKARGDPDWRKADQTNMLIGASDGNSTTYEYGTDPLSGYPNLALYTPLEDISAGDPIISGISRKIRDPRYGGYAGVHNRSKKHVTLTIMRNRTASDGTLITPVEEYEEEHMIGTTRFQRPEGIDWWVTLSLDTESVLREVRVMHESTRVGIASSKEDVQDTISDERRNTKLIVAACAVVLLLMSLYVTYSVMEPIKRVQNAMRVVATMTLEGSAVAIKPSSRLFEVRQMQVDFVKMVECLKEFRAYVPSSLLESHGGSSADGVQAAPAGNVAILFSDIQGSTALWRRSAADMNIALERHNDVIRSFYTAYEGYEVKTIGDAFMVAFSDPLNALKFALEVQTSFASQAWPAGLNLPNAGLVIRIGINYGSVIQESNPVTGRVDYRGSTVNMAARTEAKARGGTTCITSDTLAQIKASLVDVSPAPCLLSHGVHDLKGLGKHELFLLTPPGQKHRLREDTTDTAPREDDSTAPNQQLLAPDLSQSMRSHGSSGQRTSLGESVLAGKGQAANNNKKTMLQLTKAHITVAVCRLHESEEARLFDNCNLMVRAAHEASLSTEGVIGTVTGNSMTIMWNASKRCSRHSTAALTFASQLAKRTSYVMRIGLASGSLLHGNVGTQRSRFSTAFGLPLETADAMAELAKLYDTYCLFADCTHDNTAIHDPEYKSCMRLLDGWLTAREKRVVSIYEVDCSLVETQMEAWVGGAGRRESTLVPKDFLKQSTLVQSVLRGGADAPEDLNELRKLSAENPSDKVLALVVNQLSSGAAPSNGFRIAVTFSRLPSGATNQCQKLGEGSLILHSFEHHRSAE